MKFKYVTTVCDVNYYFYFEFTLFHCCNNIKSSRLLNVTFAFSPFVLFLTIALIHHMTILCMALLNTYINFIQNNYFQCISLMLIFENLISNNRRFTGVLLMFHICCY